MRQSIIVWHLNKNYFSINGSLYTIYVLLREIYQDSIWTAEETKHAMYIRLFLNISLIVYT